MENHTMTSPMGMTSFSMKSSQKSIRTKKENSDLISQLPGINVILVHTLKCDLIIQLGCTFSWEVAMGEHEGHTPLCTLLVVGQHGRIQVIISQCMHYTAT